MILPRKLFSSVSSILTLLPTPRFISCCLTAIASIAGAAYAMACAVVVRINRTAEKRATLKSI